MLNFIIWDGSPALFTSGSFVLRWYGILFIAGLLISRLVLLYLFKKEGRPIKEVNTLLIYLLLSMVIGSRIVYVLFYQPNTLFSNPLTAFLPFDLKPSFHFTGVRSMSAHGAAIGVLLSLWMYSRKTKLKTDYLSLLDKATIVSPIIAASLLLGSFFNSVPAGTPTDSSMGTVSLNPITEGLMKVPCCVMRIPGGKNPLEDVSVGKDKRPKPDTAGLSPIILYLFFKPGATEQIVKEFLIGDVKAYLFDRPDYIYEPGTEPLHYTIFVDKSTYIGRVRTLGIARHPVQIYEAIVSLVVFALAFILWKKLSYRSNAGRIFGLVSVVYWLAFFVLAYLKTDRAAGLIQSTVSIEHIASMVMVALGAIIFYFSYRKTNKA